jgi:isopentenyl phosphate kinase
MKNITFIKIGGAVITDKSIPMSVNHEVMAQLVHEIAQARKEKELTLVLGNGAGSFAHVPAKHYQTMEGFISDESKMGMAITQDSAAQLNRIFVAECLKHNIPALTLAPSNTVVTDKRQEKSFCDDILKEYIHKGMVPVTYGDVLVDRHQGCTIWSTDTVFSFFARQLSADGFNIQEIIHVTQAQGVWKNEQKEIYDVITPNMKEELRSKMTDVHGFDVTGGMWHKIEESISLTDLNIKTRIISGLQKNALYHTLMGDPAIGTLITNQL